MVNTLYDGVKSIQIGTLDDVYGTTSIVGNNISSPARAWALVGWVNRCVNIRANSVAHMPWSVFRGEAELSRSDDIGDALPWLGGMGDLLYLTEASLAIVSEAYLYKQATRAGRINGLQWLAADTITPIWALDTPEIDHFTRLGGLGPIRFQPDEIVYTRHLSPLDEQGYAPSPVAAAMAEAGVMYNLSAFASQYFARGAIKAMLLTVEGSPSPDEIAKLETWWKRWFRGIRTAWETAAVRAAVKPVIVGEGVGDLSNRELVDEKRESISTTMGVPHSLVMSNAANYATAQADRLSLYDFTILPECRIIGDALNRQLFRPLGLELVFRPESLPIYQADEREASETIKNLADAGVRPSHSLLMLGRTLPDGVTAEQFDAQFIARIPSTPPAPVAPAVEDVVAQEDTVAADAEAKAFRRWLKNNPNRLGRLADFSADHITEDDKKAIAHEVATKAAVEDDAEYAARMKLEKRVGRDIAAALEDWLSSVIPGLDANNVHQLAASLRDGSARVRDVLQQALMASADLGADVALDQMGILGVGFDYTAPHVEASRWVRQYTDDLMAALNTTNDRLVGEAVARWIENSLPMESLIDDLRPWFGTKRAETIARTEVTRAYAEGSKAAYRESGVVEKLRWHTRQDEMVCSVCGPLHEETVALEDGEFLPGVMVPPAHPNCRCYIAPVVG